VDAQLLNILILEKEHIIADNVEDTVFGFGAMEQNIVIFAILVLNSNLYNIK
jgi:hypothetical protein